MSKTVRELMKDSRIKNIKSKIKQGSRKFWNFMVTNPTNYGRRIAREC